MMALRKIFQINLGLAIVFSLAHIPLLVMSLLGVGGFKEPWMVKISFILAPLDVVLLVSSATALIGNSESLRILRLQAVVLGIFGAGIAGLLLYVLVFGIPGGLRFSWTPGLGAVFCGYATYLLRRAFAVPKGQEVGSYHKLVGAVVGTGEVVLMIQFVANFFEV